MSKANQTMILMGAWQGRYDTLAPKTMDLGSGFGLCDVDGADWVRLSNYRGKKPVFSIFDSFIWPPFVQEAVSLRSQEERMATNRAS